MYNHPLPAMLSATVPLYMMEIEQAGGPTTEQLESLSELAQMLGERGEASREEPTDG